LSFDFLQFNESSASHLFFSSLITFHIASGVGGPESHSSRISFSIIEFESFWLPYVCFCWNLCFATAT